MAGLDIHRMLRGVNVESAEFANNLRFLSSLMNEQEADAARLEKAIEKYGFSIEQLGPAFRQQKLHDQALELIEDWRVLVGSGIDLTLVNSKMATAINEYLQLALRTGAEVPSAMRPILQSLVDQGLLLDANGNAVTDLGQLGIVWSQTMTQGFDRVVAKLQELIDKLQDTGQAIEDIPNIIPIDIVYNDPGLPGGGTAPGPGGENSPPLNSLPGYVYATNQGTGNGGSKTGGGNAASVAYAPVTIEMEGRPVAKAIIKLIPNELALMGVR
jgi:hypothetical protein